MSLVAGDYAGKPVDVSTNSGGTSAKPLDWTAIITSTLGAAGSILGSNKKPVSTVSTGGIPGGGAGAGAGGVGVSLGGNILPLVIIAIVVWFFFKK